MPRETGVNSVTIPRINRRTGKPVWDIDTAIILPSDMEIILDNCHLRQAEGSFDNIFRNFADPATQGHTLAERSHNIIIRGLGHAVLDGGRHNGLTEKTSLVDGMPHISRNSMILLYNIRDFVLENFEMRDARYWALDLLFAERGRISQLHFAGDCHCRNQDGIDLRVGCSNIIIEKITGQTGDDVIALSAIGNNTSERSVCRIYRVEGHDEDIHNITIRDVVATSVECAVIALRNCDGRKIHDITIDNVHCNDNYAYRDSKHYPEYPTYKIKPFDICRIRKGNMPYALLRIGQPGYYKDRDSILGETYNIHATNLHLHLGCVIMVNVALENSYFGNIYAENDVDYIFTTKEARAERIYGANLRNVVVENVFYNNRDNDFATAFDLDKNVKDCTAEGFVVRNAFVGNCKNVFHAAYGRIEYSGVRGTCVDQETGVVTAGITE